MQSGHTESALNTLVKHPDTALRYFIRHPALLLQYVRTRNIFAIEQQHLNKHLRDAQNKYSQNEKLFTDMHEQDLIKEIGTAEKSACFWAEFLYYLIRRLKPRVVVETGVYLGVSSSFILQAISDNKDGSKLYSIDLPGYSPRGAQVGQYIPNQLRQDWRLILKESRIALPELVSDLGDIDIFVHDSDHSYENMMFEYKTSWPHIKKGGYLISDDINANTAFQEFAVTNGTSFTFNHLGKTFGIIRKST